MSRYIDADAFVADSKWCGLETAEQVLFALDHQPSIDIVRCKECKWYRIGEYSGIYVCHRGLWDVTGNSFCSYGERKEGE